MNARNKKDKRDTYKAMPMLVRDLILRARTFFACNNVLRAYYSEL
jgi:hypothetical protein